MKYRIKDEDGKEVIVEEMNDEEVDVMENEEPIVDEPTSESLSPEEISALKRLAAVADKLVGMCEGTTDALEEIQPEVKDDEAEEEEMIEDEDENPEEEIIDTKARDSKKSFGAIEKREKSSIEDSIDSDVEIADAWAKRYGGAK